MSQQRRRSPRGKGVRAALGVLLAGTAGCAVGPDFHPPEAPTVSRYPTRPLPSETVAADVPAGEAQRFVPARDIPAEWWSLFQSETLDALVRQALRDSPKLVQAQARLAQ